MFNMFHYFLHFLLIFWMLPSPTLILQVFLDGSMVVGSAPRSLESMLEQLDEPSFHELGRLTRGDPWALGRSFPLKSLKLTVGRRVS
jgi:hypothetical protein